MKKYYFFLPFACLLSFSACNSTSALNHFENNPQSAKAIQYSKKADLIYKKEINSMVFLTYLNKTTNEYKSNTTNTFLFGVHLVNKNDHDFIKNSYSIKLNNKEPLSIEQINSNSKLVSSIPLKNNWANYYIIKFEDEENNSLNINFTHPIFGKTQVSFQK